MRGRAIGTVLAGAVVLASLAVPGLRAEEPPPPVWLGQSSMIAGTAQLDAGEWIYQDFVYDDYGARAGRASSQTVSLAPTAGSFRYPAGSQYAGNAADLVEVRVRPEGGDLAVRITLNTLADAAVPVVGIGIDTGAGSVQQWPHGAGVRSSWDHFATIADGEVALLGPDGVQTAPAIVDVEANTINVVLPGLGSAGELGLTVGAGLWDGNEWMAGSPAGVLPGTFDSGGVPASRVFDLAFNSADLEPRSGRWMEDAQAGALLFGDVSDFTQRVSLDDLRAGLTEHYELQPGRYYNGLFTSRQELGEGMAGSFPQYRGRTQPYGLWVPDSYDPNAATPLLVVLHSLSSHHNQYQGGDTATSYRTFNEQLADPLGAIAVTPLGRGPDGWYRNEALVDTLEVLADVEARFDVDADRTWLTGYSMGGYGTYRVGTLLPDRFAAAISWAGVPTDGDRLDNMRWVPTQIVHGTADELVPVTGVRAQAGRFAALGHEYRYFEHPAEDHLSFVFKDHWGRDLDWLLGRTRVTQPPTVSLAVQPAMWTTNVSNDRRTAILGHLEALGADFTSAYWVRDVALRGGETARVEATSHALAARVPAVAPYRGASPALEPSPYLIAGQWRTLDEAEVANTLEVDLRSVGQATINVADAGLDRAAPLRVEVTSDGPALLRLDGGYSAVSVTDEAGVALPFTVEDGAVVLSVEEGPATFVVTPHSDGGGGGGGGGGGKPDPHPGQGNKPDGPRGKPSSPPGRG